MKAKYSVYKENRFIKNAYFTISQGSEFYNAIEEKARKRFENIDKISHSSKSIILSNDFPC